MDTHSFWKEVKRDNKKKQAPDIIFFYHFKNLAGRESRVGEEGREEIRNQPGRVVFCERLDAPISMTELNKAISQLKNGKAAGEDNILNEFLLYSPIYVRTFMLLIFNCILNAEYFPSY